MARTRQTSYLPAHVRDDAHGGEDLAGGIDPIELSIGYSQAIEILRNKKGTPSPADLSKSSVKEILEYCANFTNENFFSKDSICNVEPQIERWSGKIGQVYK